MKSRVLIILFLVTAMAGVSRAGGSLDTTFGTGGTYYDSVPTQACFGIYPAASATQTDGKVVVVGYIFDKCNYTYSNSSTFSRRLMVRRYLANGTPDSSGFGIDGFGAINAGSGISIYGQGYRVVSQSDGSVVVAGIKYGGSGPYGLLGNYAIVWKFTSSGFLDTSFGSAGVTTFASSFKPSYANALAAYSGKLVVGLSTDNNTQVRVQRLYSNGSIDPNFGTFAQVITNIDPSQGFDVAVFPRLGDIVVTGKMPNPDHSSVTEPVVAKYYSNGNIQTLFGGDGRSFYAGCGGDMLLSFDRVAFQSSGLILASSEGIFGNFAAKRYVVQYGTDGHHLPSFGGTPQCGLATSLPGSIFQLLSDDSFLLNYTRFIHSGFNDGIQDPNFIVTPPPVGWLRTTTTDPGNGKIVFTTFDNGAIYLTRVLP